MEKKDLKIFVNIPRLETERLVLRKMEQSDYRGVFEYASNPEVTRYLLWSPHENVYFTKAYLKEVQKHYKKQNFFDWGITLKGENKVIGTCGFSSFNIQNNTGEIGYVLGSEYWGRGIAAEASAAVIDFGFKVLRLHRIEAKLMTENSASKRVLEKCAMQEEGIKRGGVFAKGEYRDVAVFSITEDEYINNTKKTYITV